MSKLLCWLAWTVLCTALVATEQETWRRNLAELTARPVQEATAEDLLQLEANARLAVPYFYGLRPGEYEANRRLIQQAASFLASAELIQRDPQFRQALGRAYVALAALRWLPAYGRLAANGPGPNQQTQQPVGPTPPDDPGFARQAPETANVLPAHREVAEDLSMRYEQAVGKATLAWKSAVQLRRTLREQGLTLNANTEASVARLQLYVDLAMEALLSRNWAEAKLSIERIEYESDRIHKVTGR